MRRINQTLPRITDPGDLIIGDPATGSPIILPKGSVGEVMTVDPDGDVNWEALADYQPLDDTLTDLAALTSIENLESLAGLDNDADTVPYFNGVDMSTTGITAAARSLLDDATASAMRTTLGLVSGGSGDIWVQRIGDSMTGDLYMQNASIRMFSNVADNAAIYAYDTTDGGVVLFNSNGEFHLAHVNASGNWVANRISCAVGGLVTIPNLASASADISGGSVTGITDLAVADGGTGASSASAARTNLGVSYGTTSGTVSEGDHTHAGAGLGDVVGPASAIDGGIAIYDGTTGKLLKGITGTGLLNIAAGVATTQNTTGSGAVVRTTSPTIVTPTIASFASANHNHSNSAGGGTLDAAAIASGTMATARLGSGATSANYLRGDSTYNIPNGLGMVILNPGGTSFAASAAVNINNVFTASYANYMIILSGMSSAGNPGVILFRLRVGGVDSSSGLYRFARNEITPSGGNAGGSNTGTSVGFFQTSARIDSGFAILYVSRPQLTSMTDGTFQNGGNSNSSPHTQWGGFVYEATTSFDGFSIIPTASTLTGIVRVYGIVG